MDKTSTTAGWKFNLEKRLKDTSHRNRNVFSDLFS